MIDYILEEEPRSLLGGLQAMWVMIRQTDTQTGTQSYRRLEVIIDRELDHAAYVAANLDTLWSSEAAYEIGLGDWLRVEKGAIRNYYRAIMVAAYAQLMTGNGVVGANTAAQAVIAQDPGASAEYALVEAALQDASDTDLRTLLAQFMFAVTGDAAGT